MNTQLAETNDYDNYTNYKIISALGILVNNSFSISTSDNQKYANDLKSLFAKPVVDLAPEIIKCNENGELTTTNKEALKTIIANIIDNLGFNYEIYKSFFISTIDFSLPPKAYIISDLKYIPFIIMEYSRNANFVKAVNVSCNNIFDSSIFEKPYNFSEFFKFKITVDISTLLTDMLPKNNVKTATKKSKKKEKRTEFSSQAGFFFNELEKHVREKQTFSLYRYDLPKMASTNEKNLNSAVSRLNTQYQEIYNTDKTLLKCRNKNYGVYDIYDAWNLKGTFY